VVSDLQAHLRFLIEVDRLKCVNRQSKLMGGGRRENSAEHSWHLALFALVLGDNQPIDMLKTVTMLLIHDLVEIDAGDTPIHGTDASKDAQALAETAAAGRIFGLLPPVLETEFLALWEEFEAGESPEARFAKGVDRLQPLIANLMNDGGTWTENNVSETMVIERYGPLISTAFPSLWPGILGRVRSHFAQKNHQTKQHSEGSGD
jgi:putative hydrolases of HD superfamily